MDHHRNNLVDALRPGATQRDVEALLGAPEANGTGIAGARLWAYRGGTIQLALKDELLFLVSVYFDRPGSGLEWPAPFASITDLSCEMREPDVLRWIDERRLRVERRIATDSGAILVVGSAQFVLEADQLASLHLGYP